MMNLNKKFHVGYIPDPQLSVSDWASQYRILSQTASSEPGLFRCERTPYLKAIMDALSSTSLVEKVVFMKGAQIGGTEAGNNWVGYIIDQAPGPMLVVQPTVEMGKRWSKGRLSPLIEDTMCLRGKVKSPRSRDSGNTVQCKEFTGGMIVITGANSAVGLRSMPVKYLFCDEIDAYPQDADMEGDPLSLAIQRTNTFSSRKIFMVSTPTIQGSSRIEKEYQNSDQRQYHVPCPHCHAFQVLKWMQIKWQDHNPETVYYKCEFCKEKIFNHHKTKMLENGKWIAQKPQSKVAGFHLSSLYSPVGWAHWQALVEEFLKAQKDEAELKVWVNTTLGETWVDKGEAPEWERLFDRRKDYPMGIVPKDALIVTAGVDVQKDRLELEIVAWGKNHNSWSVDYIVIDGDPAIEATWHKLTKVLTTPLCCSSGPNKVINMTAIDAGYATQEVYNYVRQNSLRNIMAVKGIDKALVPLGTPKRIDVTYKGQTLKRGVKLWPVGVSILKSELYQQLKLHESPCHFPKYDPEYFKQLTAEQLVTKVVKGYPKREWQKMRERNEALDCRIYARAAAIAMGIDRVREVSSQQNRRQVKSIWLLNA